MDGMRRSISVPAVLDIAYESFRRAYVPLLLVSLLYAGSQLPVWALQVAASASQVADRSADLRDAVRGLDQSADAEVQASGESPNAHDAPRTPRHPRGQRLSRAFDVAIGSQGAPPSPRTRLLVATAGLTGLVTALCFGLPVMLGGFRMGIAAARGAEVRFADVWRGYRRYGWSLLAYLLQGLATAPPVVAGMMALLGAVGVGLATWDAGEHGPVVPVPLAVALIAVLVLGALVAIAVGLWLAARLGFTMFAMVDPAGGDPGPVEALRRSWRATRGNVLAILATWIIVGILGVLTVSCCVLPLIALGLPAIMAIAGAAWVAMTPAGAAGEPPIARNPANSAGNAP